MGRSSNMPQIQPIIERLMEEARPYNRVYVASVHADLNENDLQRYISNSDDYDASENVSK